MRGVIYKYTSPSGKVYIGQTLNEYMRRAMWKNINHPYAGPYINRQELNMDTLILSMMY